MKDLARKYRPKLLADLVGQPVIVRTLSNAIKKDNLHHAYLFVGQFGSGKSSTARILAAMENCLVSPGLNPCGNCDICKKVFVGTHTDVKEVDTVAIAGEGAKKIRELKQDAYYNPIDGCRTKYYILEECHRFSETACDALLKVLEEPPSRVRFILCTTDVHKMRPAIQSRCQRHDVRPIYWLQIAERLKEVAKYEKVDVEEGAINLCARLAQGSMRNGLQNLEKLYAFADGEITATIAEEMFGTVSETLLYDLFDQVVGMSTGDSIDTSSGLQIINRIFQTGTEFGIIYKDIAEYLRNMIVILTSTKAFDFIDVSQEGKRRLKEQCLKCQEKKRHRALFHIQSALDRTRQSVDLNINPEHALQSWFARSVIFFNDQSL